MKEIWARDKTRTTLHQTLNPRLSRQTPAVQQLGLDSSLPLVHRSWSFKNQLYSSTSSASENLPLHVKKTSQLLNYLSHVSRQERWWKTNFLHNAPELQDGNVNNKSKHTNAFLCHCLFDNQTIDQLNVKQFYLDFTCKALHFFQSWFSVLFGKYITCYEHLCCCFQENNGTLCSV